MLHHGQSEQEDGFYGTQQGPAPFSRQLNDPYYNAVRGRAKKNIAGRMVIAGACLIVAMAVYGSLWARAWLGAFRNMGTHPSFTVSTSVPRVPGISDFQNLLSQGNYDEAYKLGATLEAGTVHSDADGLNKMAWSIVDPDARPAKQDLALALKAAQRAVDLTGRQNWAYLDTLARVYADKGDIAKAYDIQLEALFAAPDPSVGTARDSLREYKTQLNQKTSSTKS